MSFAISDSDVKPAGRASVDVHPDVLTAVEDSAKRDAPKLVKFAGKDAEKEFEDFKRMLTASKIRRAFLITTQRIAHADGSIHLRFHAVKRAPAASK